MLKTYNTHVAEHEKKKGFTHNLTVLFRDKQKTDTKENFCLVKIVLGLINDVMFQPSP